MFPIREGWLEDFASWSKFIEYDALDRMEYVGFVNPVVFPGKDEIKAIISETDKAAWAIMKLTYDGDSDRIETVSFVRDAKGDVALDQIFDNNAALTYT
jgi:hypothetical protein